MIRTPGFSRLLRHWVAWVLACGVGGSAATAFAALVVGHVLAPVLALNNGLLWFATLAGGVGVAASLFAIPQWLLLRNYVPGAGRWVATTAWSGALGVVTAYISVFPIVGTLALMGTPVAALLHLFVPDLRLPLPDWTLYLVPAAVTGFVVGASQARLLALATDHPGRWVGASILGAVAVVLGGAAGANLAVFHPAADALVVGSIAYGMVTGVAMAALISRYGSSVLETRSIPSPPGGDTGP